MRKSDKPFTQTLHVGDMTCAHCERTVEDAVRSLPGVLYARANHADGTVRLRIDPHSADPHKIEQAIGRAGYRILKDGQAEKKSPLQALSLAAIFGLVYIMLSRHGAFSMLPQIQEGMGYGLLFVTGLATSVHCIAMCGGISISQGMVKAKPAGNSLKGPLLYNTGRVMGYTLVGAAVGALGRLVQLPGWATGLFAILAGVWMTVMALNMMGLFSSLRRFFPRLPPIGILTRLRPQGALGIGLLNALMPCGPLQAMQLYALGTGSALGGALSMLFFSLGTVPLMLGLGAITSRLTRKKAQQMLQAGAALVLVLGVGMLGNGLNLSGVSPAAWFTSLEPSSIAQHTQDGQTVTSQVTRNAYEPVTVEVGVPVQLNFKADSKSLNGCNNEIIIPQYGIRQPLKPGNNWVAFTPEQTGTINFSCWMGMISSQIRIVDSLEAATTTPAL